MHGHHVKNVVDPGPLRVPSWLPLACLLLAVVGALAFAYGAFVVGDAKARQNAWAGFFVSGLFVWMLAMGAAAFLAIQYVVSAKWFYVMKRIPEAIAAFAYRGGFLLPLVALGGIYYLYPWADSRFHGELWPYPWSDYVYEGTAKAWWISPGVSIIKTPIYIAILTLITLVLVRTSRRPSPEADGPVAQARLRNSILFLIFFGFVFSIYSWEMIMSIEVKWFSTMFGVYMFSGAFVAAISLMMLIMFHLRARSEHVKGRHMYDMGTYVMAFATFMVYIGFSQFMLIWYANLYDETFFFMKRYEEGWVVVTLALPVLKWVIPFFLLMPPPLRTNVVAQTICCTSILLGQLLDIYWIVYPAYYSELTLPSVVNVLTFAGAVGLFGWSTLSALGASSLLPVEDKEDLLNSINGDYLHA